jgi:hypothetical protein
MLNQNRRLQSVHRIANNLDLNSSYQTFYPEFDKQISFAWTEVRLPKARDKKLWLLVFQEVNKSPVALLTNEKLPSPKKAARLISYYFGRYSGCEDSIRFVKQQFKIEKFRIEGMPAIRNWFFWISVAFTMLFDFQTHREILRQIINYSKAFPNPATFLYYRILRGINYLLRDFFPYGALARAKIL